MDFVHSRFGTRDAAEYAVSTLLEAGFPRAMISLSADEPRRRSGPGAGASPHDASQRASHTRATGMFGGVVGALMGASLAPFALSVSTGTMTESAVLAIATGACVMGAFGSRVALCVSPRALEDEEPDGASTAERRPSVVMVRARFEHADRASRILERCGGGSIDAD